MKGIINHVLTGCSAALDHVRLDPRHHSIVLRIDETMRENKSHSDKCVLADVQGFQLPNGGTVPPEVFVAAKKPDIVIIVNNAVKSNCLNPRAVCTNLAIIAET